MFHGHSCSQGVSLKRHATAFEFAEDLCHRFKVAAVEALQRQHWDAPATRHWNDDPRPGHPGHMVLRCRCWGEFSTGSSALRRWFVGSRRLPIEPRRDWDSDWWMFFIGSTSMYRALDLEIWVSCSWTLGKPGLHSHRWHRRKPPGRTRANRQGQLSLSAVESWRQLWRALDLKCFENKRLDPKLPSGYD